MTGGKLIAIVVGGVTVTSLLITTVVVKSGLWSRRALPVLFVHGWGNTSQIWDVRKYDEAFRDDKRFAFHGYLEATSNGVALRPPDGEMSSVIHPIYRVDLPDGASGNIIDNGKALARSISMVREVTGADSVVLVGFSLGGVICREYVTSEGYANDVKRVITISSPHGGTEFADFASWRRKIAEVQETGSGLNQVGAKALITALDLAADGMGLKLSGEALEMLELPSNGNYLFELNARPHPREVEWFSIIAEKNIANYQLRELWTDLSSGMGEDPKSTATFAVLSDFLRNIRNLPQGVYLGGDGVVSTESQDMTGIAGLRGCPVKTFRVEASHMQDFIQKELVKLLIGEMETWEYAGDAEA